MIIKIHNLALDVDGVLSNFAEGVIDRANELGLGDAFPLGWRDVKCWDISPRFHDVMRPLWGNVDFWSNLYPMPGVRKNIQPAVYLTSRPIPSDVTEAWLKKYGFPEAPVVTVDRPELKIPVLKEKGLWLVDDHHHTVQKCVDEGLTAYLYRAPYQRGYNVSHLPTVSSLQEVIDIYEGKNTLRRIA